MTLQKVSFQKGQELTIETGQKVTLTKQIGDGYTAIVFIAIIMNLDGSNEEVVVKIAKPNEDAERLVNDECEILKKLYSDIRLNNKAITPRVYGQGKANNSTFIVMEFVKAQPLMELQDGKPLVERIGLMVGSQLFDFLDTLHSVDHYAYPDMKEENFFWVPEADNINLRVIDLGGLEKCSDLRNDPRYERDVYRAAQYLYKLLSGSSLLTSWNYELEEDPIKPINDRSDISHGTKNLLINLLARDEKFRLTDAHDIKLEIETLLRFWNESSENLVQIAIKNIERANSQQVSTLDAKAVPSDRASNILDIYLRRFPERKGDAEGICKQADDLAKAVGLLNRAWINIKTKNFKEAQNLLAKGEETSTTPEVFRRLNYMLEDIEKVDAIDFTALFDLYGEIMNSINDFPESVIKVCDDQKNRYPKMKCFSLIIEDINYEKNMTLAEKFELKGEFDKCITALKEARTNLDNLPKTSKITRDNKQSIDLRILNLEKKSESIKSGTNIEIKSHAFEEGINAENIENLISELLLIFRGGGYTPKIDKEITKAISISLENRKIDEANRLAQLVRLMPEHSQELLNQSKIAVQCSECEKVLKDSSDFVIFSAFQKLCNLPGDRGKKLAKEYLNQAVERKLIGEDENLLQQFHTLAISIDGEDLAEQISIVIDEIHRQKVQSIMDRLDDIEFSLFLENPWSVTFEKYLQMIQTKPNAEIVSFVENSEARLALIENEINSTGNIESKEKDIAERLSKIRVEFNKQKTSLTILYGNLKEVGLDYKNSKDSFLHDWEKFYLENEKYFSFINPQTDVKTVETLFSQTLQYYKRAILITLQGEDVAIFQKMGSQLFRALDSLKSYPIDSFKEKFKDETRLDNQELIAETEMLFNNGELLASLERLESISPLQQISSEVQEKRQKIFRAYAYEFLLKQKKQSLNRAEYDAGMIELIQKNREIQLPKASLQKCQIKEYLDYVSKDIYAEARSYSVSLNSLDKNKDEYTLNGFKQCIEKLVSIESAFLAISY